MANPRQLGRTGIAERSRAPVSVVIPTFNRTAVLGRCLDSVLGQTLPADEVIVVDDASEDDTAAIVAAYGPAVRYLQLPTRSGAQAARNRGIREAQGDWVAFQDSDDEWLPDKLERQVALLAERDFDPWTVVHGGAIVRDRTGSLTPMQLPPLADDPLGAMLREPATLFPAMVVSRSALEQIGGLEAATPRGVCRARPAPVRHRWDGLCTRCQQSSARSVRWVTVNGQRLLEPVAQPGDSRTRRRRHA